VATPDGEQAISSLKVGDQVQAYDPQTGQVSDQTVQHVWINHDTDLLDVTLQVNTDTINQTTQTQTTSTSLAGQKSPNAVQNDQTKSVAGAAESPTTAPQAETAQEETIHTTANHPWLTADRGWVVAGKLQVGEPVLRADGTTAVVADLQVVPGAGTMYDLEVSHIHTFEVGLGHWVVHNSRGPCKSSILDANLGGKVGDGLQAHHIIPCECQYMDVVVKSGLDINGRVNGILLPSDQSVAIINAQLRHYTNHQGWTDFMTEVLEQEEAKLPKIYTAEEAQAAVSWAIGRGRRMLDAMGFFFPGEPIPRE
jgi:hypothetical protein